MGRAPLPLAGLGLGALDPDAALGDDQLRATPEEAHAILHARGCSASQDAALAASGGWLGGLVLIARGAADRGEVAGDLIAECLAREIRPTLTPGQWDLLVACSVLDEVDVPGARALGASVPRPRSPR